MIKWEYLKLEWRSPFQARAGYAQPSGSQWRVEDTGASWEGHDFMGALADLGQEGWELASIVAHGSGAEFAILKRPIADG